MRRSLENVEQMVRARRLLAVVTVALLAGFGASPASAVVVLPEADVQLTGVVDEGPPGAGVTTSDTMVYEIRVRNNGPAAIPAGSLLMVLFVDRAEGSDPVTIEVVRFNHGDNLGPAPGGACGNGRRLVVQCTNASAIAPDEEITLQVGHRHPTAEAGALSFVAEVSRARNLFGDPNAGNNSFRGPAYGFINPPTTTTTTTTSTTMPSTSTTVDPSSTTTDPSSTSTTTTTTMPSSTTTTATTSTTTTSTTTTSTTEAPTTSSTSTSLAALTGSASLPTSPDLVQDVAGTSEATDDEQLAAPVAQGDSGGGPPYLLLAGLTALVMLLGGVGLAAYAQYNRPPPLVDIRRFE